MSKMEKMQMCRICLVENVRMNIVDDKELQKLYETLTDIPFVTEDRRPMLTCFLCFAQLKQCCQLQRKCREAEELFDQMMNEPNPLVNRDEQKVFSEPAATPAENISHFECVTIKQELPDDCETQDDNNEPRTEHFEYELELELLNNSYSDADDIPAQQSKPSPEHDVPLIKIKTEVKEEQEVLRKKRGASDTTRTVAVQKRHPPTRGKKLEDVILEIRKKNQESDTKVSQNIQSGSSSKLIPKFQELLANTRFVSQVSNSVTFNTSCVNNIKTPNVTNDIRTHTREKTYECKECLLCFSQKCHLTNHIRTHTGEKPYKCEECHLCFSRKDSLSRHIRSHTDEKPYKCEECQRCFRQKDGLTRHIRAHTGEKPYKCEVCELCFSHPADFTRHMRRHTGVKPYKCEECQLCFSQKIHLTNHIRSHTGEKPYKCEECQRCFSQKIHLIRHVRMHTGEKPYKCEQCDLCFSLKSTLLTHIRRHTGEKPFKCTECQLSFSQKATLLRHILTHTGEKPFKCEECQLCFRRKQQLKKHICAPTGETEPQWQV